MSTSILVTGGTGFIGTTLCALLREHGYRVRRALRRATTTPDPDDIVVGEIDEQTAWSMALEGVGGVIHLAARVHVRNDSPGNAHAYTRSNADATRQLADAAAQAGVRRFVFLSSIKVNGERSAEPGFSARDRPQPVDAYGRSKWLAEQHLQEIAARSALQVASVRPPLVYGPGVKANFLRLMSAVDRGVPLPFASVENQRSLVSVWNLCDLLLTLLTSSEAARQPWLVRDPEQLSTPELIRRIAAAMQRKARLLPAPVALLRGAAKMAGRGAEFERLCGSLLVDDSDTRRLLHWSPPVSVDEGLRRTAAWYFARPKAAAHA